MVRFLAAALILSMLAACAPRPPQADHILVLKSERRMMLFREGAVMASYPIALGFTPKGHKLEEGDGRTPEGRYVIDTRNPESKYFLSLRIDYPHPADVEQAVARGVSPGGEIFIHGQPNGENGLRSGDWTAGCIAVDNLSMKEIWERVRDGTTIEILP